MTIEGFSRDKNVAKQLVFERQVAMELTLGERAAATKKPDFMFQAILAGSFSNGVSVTDIAVEVAVA